jgi:serine protease inhibitor
MRIQVSKNLSSLTADKWAAWISDFEGHEGYLELPRFRSEYRAPITAILEDLGVERAFTSFGSFAPAVSNPEGAALTRVLQAILLSVDEKGTEVVSAGVIGGVIGGVTRRSTTGTVSYDREPSVLLRYLRRSNPGDPLHGEDSCPMINGFPLTLTSRIQMSPCPKRF